MNYKEALEKAKNRDAEITCKDLDQIISVLHSDGSHLEFHNACCKRLDAAWFGVYTEHNGFNVYHYEDIDWIQIVTRKYLYVRDKE